MKHRSIFVGMSLCAGLSACSQPAPESAGEELGVATQAEHGAKCAGAVVSDDHFVPVSSGATLHVVEKHAPAAACREHRRAVLMLPATIVTNILWNADVPGAPQYNALLHAAHEGFYAYSLDWEGYGSSTHPVDGKTVTKEVMLKDAGDLLEWIRHRDHVSKVDLFGSSLGSGVAAALGSTESPVNRHHVGRIVLTANVYASITPFAAQVLLSPPVEQQLLSAPNGYVDTIAPFYGVILSQVEPAPLAYCDQDCPGHYAVGPTLEGFSLPNFDAHTGRAPMLQFWGTNDLITPLTDAQQFQSEYGGPAALVVLNGGGHVPFWEPVRQQFWQNADAFLGADDDDEDVD